MPTDDTKIFSLAFAEAYTELTERGFVPGVDGAWSGVLSFDGGTSIATTVTLPPDFPHAIPIVRISIRSLPRSIPHVEVGGKVCLTPESGVLLDGANPRGIIRDSLALARRLIAEGLSGKNQHDFVAEFAGYWNAGAREGFLSLANPTGKARVMALVRLDLPISHHEILAENLPAAIEWLSKIGRKVVSHRVVLFLPLIRPFGPPGSGDSLTVNETLDQMQHCSTPSDYAALLDHLKQDTLPITIAFSLPVGLHDGFAVAAFRLEKAHGQARLHSLKADRKTSRSTLWELWCSGDQAVTRLRADRGDPDFILPRGGADVGLLRKRVVVVGCGSVGSRVAEHLASMGVGQLLLIDQDRLLPENIHRHLLGTAHLGLPKAAATASVLRQRFPHLVILNRDETIQQVLVTDPGIVRDADIVIMALGDETLELRLNDMLSDAKSVRVHVWLEPLGLGGHVLVCRNEWGAGCYRCLFGWADGIANSASFAKPGQHFHQTFSGCTGAFTPYASLDADRTAVEAVRLSVRVLNGQCTANTLASWFGDDSAFRQRGFLFSSRAALFNSGECNSTVNFAQTNCSCCGRA